MVDPKDCFDHKSMTQKLDIQINGVNGNGGIISNLKDVKEHLTKQDEMLDRITLRLTFGVGFLTAIQVIYPIIEPHLVKAAEHVKSHIEIALPSRPGELFWEQGHNNPK